MTGGLIQIVTYGSQDIYLTANPQITFFKYIYKRYTNFSIETIPLQFDGTSNFGEYITCNIPNNGDLIHKCCLKITLPNAKLTKNTSVNYDSELTDYNNATTKLNNFKTFSNIIFNSIRLLNLDINKSNLTIQNLRLIVSNYLNNDQILDLYIKSKNTQSNNIINKYDILKIIDNIIINSSLTLEQKKIY